MKKIIVCIILLWCQNAICQKLELGNVTLEELLEKVHPLDSTASAAYIFKTGETRFSYINKIWFTTTEVKVKLKIYNKDGFKYANQVIDYYTGGDIAEKVFFADAATYNVVNGTIEKTKLKPEGEFTEDVNKLFKLKKIVLPAIKEGSIIEFSYKIISPYYVRLKDWYFQYDIPVDYVAYDVYIPEYFQYNNIITGFENINIKSEKNKKENYFEEKTSYTKTNVPAIKDEEFVYNIRNYTSILKHELKTIINNNGFTENFSQDWDDVSKQVFKHEKFGGELKLKSYFEEELNPIIEKNSSNDEKIKAILQFVKNKITWNKNYGIYCDKGVKKAYKDKSGNVAEVNLMLVAMLRHAGFDANPVLLSTKSNGVTIFPSRTAFNYVIAAIEAKNNLILLDATSPFSFFNILPKRALNWKGRLIRNESSSTDVDLMPKKVSNEKTSIMATIFENGVVKGQFKKQYFDYAASSFRENNAEIKQESYLEKLESKHIGLKASDYNISNKDEVDSPLVEKYSFEHSNLVENIGNKLYFSPLLYFDKTTNPFKQEKRNFPIDFPFPFNNSFHIIVNIPEGYTIESIPERVSLVMENNLGYYLFNVSVSLNTIQISSTYSINASIVPLNQYETLKIIYKTMIEKGNEKIVLKKI